MIIKTRTTDREALIAFLEESTGEKLINMAVGKENAFIVRKGFLKKAPNG